MYSTNLQLSIANETTIWDNNGPVGQAYGWESVDKNEDGNVSHVGPPTQTAKDNALLWSLSPRMVELLQVAYDTGDVGFSWHDACSLLLDKLAQAIPPASVAQNG